MSEIKLGCTAKDKITGFKGVVTGKVEYLSRQTQYLVAPRLEESLTGFSPNYPNEVWIDEGRLEYIEQTFEK